MNNDKMLQFVKRWRALEAAQRDLDFRISEWARDLRSEFVAGKAGDDRFVSWCDQELGITKAQADGLLRRVSLLSVVPDAKTWNSFGGYEKLLPISDMPRKEQVATIEAAKASKLTIATIVRQRSKPTPTATDSVDRPERVTASPAEDAAALAEFIDQVCPNVPRSIKRLVDRYLQSRAA